MVLVLMRSLSYTPQAIFGDFFFDATFSEELLLLVRSFSYTPDASSREEFLLLSWC